MSRRLALLVGGAGYLMWMLALELWTGTRRGELAT